MFYRGFLIEREARWVKKLYVVLICILIVSFTGCMKEYPLSGVQTDIVAEYMASRLLEKDKDYSSTLIFCFDTEDVEETLPIEESDSEPIDTADDINEDEPTQVDPSADTRYTLSEVVGDSNFEIEFKSYKLVNTYPEDESRLVFSLDPREGYLLLVVDFTIENVSDQVENIDLSKSRIQYQLDINGGTIYKPQFALLENNLKYIKLDINEGATIPAVLIFEVNREIDMSDISLSVEHDGRSKTIEIK